jgi:hypothetical protein
LECTLQEVSVKFKYVYCFIQKAVFEIDIDFLSEVLSFQNYFFALLCRESVSRYCATSDDELGSGRTRTDRKSDAMTVQRVFASTSGVLKFVFFNGISRNFFLEFHL